MKASPLTTQLRLWLEGDLLLLAKASVWRDVLATVAQQSIRGDRSALASIVVPPVVAILGGIALWQWNAALLLAILGGSGSSILLYRATQRRFGLPKLEQWLKSPHAPIALSLGGGLGMLALSYSALAVWQDLHSPWLAMMLLTQEIGIFGILGLAVWLIVSRKSKPLHSFDRCVAGLLHRDELRRLMAVRQLAKLMAQGQLSSVERSHATDYLSLLDQKEHSPIVRRAIQESLSSLMPSQRKQLGDRSLATGRIISTSAQVSTRRKAIADAS
jgi:hypothetical protein